jgi:hypothetical protein
MLKMKTMKTMKTIKAIVTWANTYAHAREETRKEEKESTKKSKEDEDVSVQNEIFTEYGWCVKLSMV